AVRAGGTKSRRSELIFRCDATPQPSPAISASQTNQIAARAPRLIRRASLPAVSAARRQRRLKRGRTAQSLLRHRTDQRDAAVAVGIGHREAARLAIAAVDHERRELPLERIGARDKRYHPARLAALCRQREILLQ